MVPPNSENDKGIKIVKGLLEQFPTPELFTKTNIKKHESKKKIYILMILTINFIIYDN